MKKDLMVPEMLSVSAEYHVVDIRRRRRRRRLCQEDGRSRWV